MHADGFFDDYLTFNAHLDVMAARSVMIDHADELIRAIQSGELDSREAENALISAGLVVKAYLPTA